MTHIETDREIRNQAITLLVIERDQNVERLTQRHSMEVKGPLRKEIPEAQVLTKSRAQVL
jgi:hypothetical protein